MLSCNNNLENKNPNVIIVITDDQGYGDIGYNGNKNIITPNLDKFASESLRFNNFHVSPVCAPTRSSLLTGRYSLRTGVTDTYNGGAIMSSSEITLAEIFAEKNYKTGIFGKWHLGDNYPSRPSDQGFQESLIHLAGGIGQVGDLTNYYAGNESYFDPALWHNNEIKGLLNKINRISFFAIYHSMLLILLCKSLKNIMIYIRILILQIFMRK